MLLLPIATPLLKRGDDLAATLTTASLADGDIVAVSSKVLATVRGEAIALEGLTVTDEAVALAKTCRRSPAFCQAILEETERRHGTVLGACPGAALTALRPDGLLQGEILTANAGLDESNVAQGWTVGWPSDPVAALRELRVAMEALSGARIALILTDSCCLPRRSGVVAQALTCSGLEPLRSEVGHRDLFGRSLTITVEDIGDQLATAANFLMGNAAQSTPAVLIRDHGLPLSDFEGWVPGMAPEKDLFNIIGWSDGTAS